MLQMNEKERIRGRLRKLALILAATGLMACGIYFSRFLGMINHNDLPINDRAFYTEHYIVVSQAYSQAFVVGFFSCFFLVLGVVSLKPIRTPSQTQ